MTATLSLLANMQLPKVYFLIRALLFFVLVPFHLLRNHRFGYGLDCGNSIPEEGDGIKLSLVNISAPEPATWPYTGDQFCMLSIIHFLKNPKCRFSSLREFKEFKVHLKL